MTLKAMKYIVEYLEKSSKKVFVFCFHAMILEKVRNYHCDLAQIFALPLLEGFTKSQT